MRVRYGRRFGTLLCVLGIMLWLAAGLVFNVSAESVDNSLTLICKTEKVTLVGMQWKLYRVGSRTDDGFVLEGDFADYPVSLEDMSASAISAAADTLENYAVLDKIPCLASGQTGNDGLLRFDGLEPGLYMVCGKNLQVGDTTYVPSAILLEIEKGEDGGQANFDLNAYPKFFYRTISSELSSYAVKKIWENDEDAPENRAVSISVEIYNDEELWKTVVLDESNDWTYSWVAQTSFDWRVKETEVPENYTVIYRSNETQFAIVNTFGGEITTQPTTSPTEPVTTPAETTVPSTEPVVPSTEPSTEVTSPSTSGEVTSVQESTTVTAGSSETVTTTVTSSSDKLPQTGQLWWPVPIMAGGGLIFISIGARLNSAGKRDS